MWNSNLNLGNTATYGARVGFGFGPILELRGNYERSFKSQIHPRQRRLDGRAQSGRPCGRRQSELRALGRRVKIEFVEQRAHHSLHSRRYGRVEIQL